MRTAPLPKTIWLALFLFLAACQRRSAPASSISAEKEDETQISPLSQRKLPTTPGPIAVSNLNAQISVQKDLLIRRGPTPATLLSLINLLSTRGQFLGQIADYEQAEVYSEQLCALASNQGESYQARAQTRATLHRFEEALEDLKLALQHGSKPAELERLRTSILQAQGHLDQALFLTEKLESLQPDIMTIGMLAALRGELGQIEQAEALFVKAQHHFDDVSPFPIAWLYLQQGLMWQNAGRLSRARELFAAAHRRLPQYAAATAHLAAVEASTGNLNPAIALLSNLVQSSDDPEYAGQLASLLLLAHKPAEAARWQAQAQSGYQALLGRHPVAFAAHAARFYLGSGQDAKRALTLALQNLERTQNSAAHELALEAALAALPPAQACAQAEKALQISNVSQRLLVLGARAFAACGQSEKASAMLKQIGPP